MKTEALTLMFILWVLPFVLIGALLLLQRVITPKHQWVVQYEGRGWATKTCSRCGRVEDHWIMLVGLGGSLIEARGPETCRLEQKVRS